MLCIGHTYETNPTYAGIEGIDKNYFMNGEYTKLIDKLRKFAT